jgi:uncharacterized protein
MKANKAVCIYYHDDYDGCCAGAIVSNYYKTKYKNITVESYCVNYGDDIPINKKDGLDYTVFIVDFSFQKEVFQKIIDTFGFDNVVWIDHHISAIEQLEEFSGLAGIRTEDFSGCMLTWMYLYSDLMEQRTEYSIMKTKKRPYIVDIVDDYDRWQFKYGNDTANLCEYMNLVNTRDLSSYFWIATIGHKTERIDLEEYMSKGSAIVAAKDIEHRKFIDKNGVPIRIVVEGVGYNCLYINSSYTKHNSNIGHIVCNDLGYDLSWTYHITTNNKGDLIRVNNLRSKVIDVYKLAMLKGGGGHPNAAGWTEIIEKNYVNKHLHF